jgi:hypothetical protein
MISQSTLLDEKIEVFEDLLICSDVYKKVFDKIPFPCVLRQKRGLWYVVKANKAFLSQFGVLETELTDFPWYDKNDETATYSGMFETIETYPKISNGKNRVMIASKVSKIPLFFAQKKYVLTVFLDSEEG